MEPNLNQTSEEMAAMWFIRQHLKGGWIVMLAMGLSFFATDFFTPTLATLGLRMGGCWFANKHIKKFFSDNRSAILNGHEVNWGWLCQLGYLYMFSLGIVLGWLALIAYIAFTTPDLSEWFNSGMNIQRNLSEGAVK